VSARAGILVTGTEVLTGRVSDRNGPWLAERLRELGVDIAYTTVVGDRADDMLASLEFMAARQLDVILTSGGLGPTADDLTAEVVGRFQGREMVLDEQLERRIAEILRPLAKRFPNIDMESVRHGNRKQATVPRGATVLEPVGTAPGLVVPPADSRGGPTVVVLPGGTRPFARRRCARRCAAPSASSSARCACLASPSRRSPRRCARPSARASRSRVSR
jgi:nicotinamide-nucleotide amidase